MSHVHVIEDPAAAVTALEPMRSRLLAALTEPLSAAGVAAKVGLARQKANYHLRALEAHGLVRVAEARMWGGLTERLLVASADGYLIAPGALGAAGARVRTADRLSAAYLIALAGRAVQEVGALLRRAEQAGKRLSTASLDAEVRFRTPADRAAFTEELTAAVTRLVARYHDESAVGGRDHRLILALHPTNADAE